MYLQAVKYLFTNIEIVNQANFFHTGPLRLCLSFLFSFYFSQPDSLSLCSLCLPVSNPCDRKKCEWLCLLSPSGPVCTCPNGRSLDNGTCVELPTPTLSPICEWNTQQCSSVVQQTQTYCSVSWVGCVVFLLSSHQWSGLCSNHSLALMTKSPFRLQRLLVAPARSSACTAAVASWMPTSSPSAAASPTTAGSAVRLTSAGITARMEAPARPPLEVRWRHCKLNLRNLWSVLIFMFPLDDLALHVFGFLGSRVLKGKHIVIWYIITPLY